MSVVDHPKHYGGGEDPYETIKVIRAWELGFNLGNVVKYVSRAGRKDPAKTIEDLEKAAWYLADEIAFLKAPQGPDEREAREALAGLEADYAKRDRPSRRQVVVTDLKLNEVTNG